MGVGVAGTTGVGAGAIGVGTDVGVVVCFSGDWNSPSREEMTQIHTLRLWSDKGFSVHRKEHLVTVFQIGDTSNLSPQLIVNE